MLEYEDTKLVKLVSSSNLRKQNNDNDVLFAETRKSTALLPGSEVNERETRCVYEHHETYGIY